MWGNNEMGAFLPLGALSIAFDDGADGSSDYSRVLDMEGHGASVAGSTTDQVVVMKGRAPSNTG
jgi:hypothetical protein